MSVISPAYQHGPYWVNDPDCLLVHLCIEQRERRVDLIRNYGGLRGLSDHVTSLDAWGLETATELLTEVPPPDAIPPTWWPS
jgi:alpha-galactosidase